MKRFQTQAAQATASSSKPNLRAKSSGPIEQCIRLRVICLTPPAPQHYGAEFGLQDNSTTADWVIHAGKVRPNGDIYFECECRVNVDVRTRMANFLGRFAHGGTAQKFLYLSWRPTAWRPEQPDPPCPAWLRRMKVHLSSITWSQIDQAARSEGVLEARVQGTGRDGGPSCGSVPLIGKGWTVRKT